MASLAPNAEASNTGGWAANNTTTVADVQSAQGIVCDCTLATERIIFDLSTIPGVLQATAVPISLSYDGQDFNSTGGQQLKAIIRSGGSDISTVSATALGVSEGRNAATLSGTFSSLTLTQSQLDALQLVLQVTGGGGNDAEFTVRSLTMNGVTYTASSVPRAGPGLGIGLGLGI